MTINFKAEAQAIRDELIERRRDLHRHPELAFHEFRTAGIVAEELTRLGLEVQTGVGKTGVVGILEGARDGKTIMIRADMDALPIHEENKTEYVSTVPGNMHACGHDAHTSIALGVAKLLAAHQEQFAGRVMFVFQPAEEIAAGAKAMLDDGLLDEVLPDVSLGFHMWPYLPVGKIGLADGPIMSGSNSFQLTLTGRGGHGAMPHQTIDPIVCGAQIIQAFQTIVSRNVNPTEAAVISVTQFHAGDADNVIPQMAFMRGTTRAYSVKVHELLEDRMRLVVDQISRAMGCAATLEYFDATRPVSNDPVIAAWVRDAVHPLLDTDGAILDERTMGAEDMGYFMDKVPGAFIFIGAGNAERELNFGLHHPRFDIDEDVLPLATALMSQAVASYLVPDGE